MVTAGPITQSGSGSNTVASTSSGAFTDTVTCSGCGGTLTFAKTAGSSSLQISSGGGVSVTGATNIAVGDYTFSGTINDSLGDTQGTWTYTLHVVNSTITQSGSGSGTVVTTSSGAFTDTVTTTGGSGSGKS